MTANTVDAGWQFEDEPLPEAVTNAAPGELNVTRDTMGGMPTHNVWIGQDHVGVIFDESSANLDRGAFAAWSSKAKSPKGTVGFFATKAEAAEAIRKVNEPTKPAAEAAPEWRTLKGITGPFLLWGEDDGEHIRFAADRKHVTGKPIEFGRWWMEGTRYGETEDGRKVHLWGVATKYWVSQL